MLIDKHGTPVYVILAYPTLPSRRGSRHRMLEQRPTWRQSCFSSLTHRKPTPRHPRPRVQPQAPMYTLSLCWFSRCVYCPVNTAEPPKARPSRPIVTAKILADLRPKRKDYEERTVPHKMWSILDSCWSFEPLIRPGILIKGATATNRLCIWTVCPSFTLIHHVFVIYIGRGIRTQRQKE
jgi:hypothetical protein